MTGFRINADDLQRTQPVVYERPEPTFWECCKDVLPFVIFGTGFALAVFLSPQWFPWAKRAMAAAALALLGACGGSDEPEPTWPDGVSLGECSISPDKLTVPTYYLDLNERCLEFVSYQCRTGGALPIGWQCGGKR